MRNVEKMIVESLRSPSEVHELFQSLVLGRYTAEVATLPLNLSSSLLRREEHHNKVSDLLRIKQREYDKVQSSEKLCVNCGVDDTMVDSDDINGSRSLPPYCSSSVGCSPSTTASEDICKSSQQNHDTEDADCCSGGVSDVSCDGCYNRSNQSSLYTSDRCCCCCDQACSSMAIQKGDCTCHFSVGEASALSPVALTKEAKKKKRISDEGVEVLQNTNGLDIGNQSNHLSVIINEEPLTSLKSRSYHKDSIPNL